MVLYIETGFWMKNKKLLGKKFHNQSIDTQTIFLLSTFNFLLELIYIFLHKSSQYILQQLVLQQVLVPEPALQDSLDPL